jgi:4-amino-4-deoxy-L-arabinose transferase-like glycosyltransferase
MSAKVETLHITKSDLRFNIFSILPVAAGFVLIVWSGLSNNFRDSENVLNAKFCLPLAIGFALILIGSFINTKWNKFAFWSALTLVGQASSLQMIDAGRLIHFQHYRSFSELVSQDVLALTLFALQIVLVAFGISKRLPVLKNRIGKNFALWQIILVALFLIFTGAAVTPDVSIYATSLVTAAVVQFVNLVNIVLVAGAVPDESVVWVREKIELLLGKSQETTKPRLDKFSISAAIWIVFLAGSLSYFVYENHPHVPDETQYLFQANYLAAGQITVKTPLVPEAFAMYMTPYQEERWFGVFPPGWSAMLAIGEKLNVVWLVNPLLAGLCVLLAYLFFQEVYSRPFARIAVLLLCCSPWFVFMAMSFMSHIFTLVCALSAAILLSRALRKQKIFYVLAAGLMVGIVSLIRPLDGVIVAVLLGVWTLFGFQTWRAKILNGLALVAGTMATAALIFPYNKSITGSAMLSPMDFYYTKYFWSGVMSLGFGENRGFHWGLDAFPGHSPLEAVINAALNMFLLNTELFGWGIGSLFLAACFLFSGSLRKKDVWSLGVIAVVICGYSLFWYHGGPDFGARYWFLCIIPLIALTVRGIEFLSQKIDESNANSRVILTVTILCTISLFAYFPWRALDKYYHYLEMRPDIRQLARQNSFGKSLVLIRGEEHPDYQSAWIYNPVNFEGDAPIYAWDKDAKIRAALLQNYPNRPVWIVDGPTRTGGGYKIVEGPIDVKELSARDK